MSSKTRSLSPYVQLEQGLFGSLPQLRAVVFTHQEDFIGLTVKQRAENDFIVVLRRYGDDGGPQVCFSSGYDFVGALLAMEGTLAADRWRADRPWDGGK